ncbi:MAG TPA: glycosyltransferase family 4 protein [Terriglobia bacterium]|nr:glycosyltransferase family 4 protein [Terriglobia bacterium]
MKILLVHNAYQRPGGEDVVFEQERRLLERYGHQVHLYHRANDEVGRESGRIGIAAETIWSRRTDREITKLLNEVKPDVVHVHNTFMVISPSVYWACGAAGVPVVQTLHNYRLLCPAATFFRAGKVCEECIPHGPWRGVRYACYRDSRLATATVAMMLSVHREIGTWKKKVTSYIALTRFARDKFVEAGLPTERIFVKPNFVDPDPGVRESDGEYGLFMGRLMPEKRPDRVIQALASVPSRFPFLIAGTGPERERLEAEVAKLGLSHVRFVGQVAREQAFSLMKKARFLVFSSEWYETFGLTMVEAFACGTPVIATRMGAMQEIVDDGRTGLHFTPGDAEDLARKMEWAWTHPESMRAMGIEARREFELRYTAEKNYGQLIEIYQKAVHTRG